MLAGGRALDKETGGVAATSRSYQLPPGVEGGGRSLIQKRRGGLFGGPQIIL